MLSDSSYLHRSICTNSTHTHTRPSTCHHTQSTHARCSHLPSPLAAVMVITAEVLVIDGPNRDSSPQPTFTTLPPTPPPSVNTDDDKQRFASSSSTTASQPLIPRPTHLHPHHSPTSSLTSYPRHHLTSSLTLLSLPSYSRSVHPSHVKSDSTDSLTQRLAQSDAGDRAEDKVLDEETGMERLISEPITKNEMQLRAAESLTAAAAATLSSGSSRLTQKDGKSPSPSPPASTPSPFLLSAHSPTPSLSSASSLLSTSPTLSPLYLTSTALLASNPALTQQLSGSPPFSGFHTHNNSMSAFQATTLGGGQLFAPRPRVAMSAGESTVSALEARDGEGEDGDELMTSEDAEVEERDSDAVSFLSFLASSPPPVVPLTQQQPSSYQPTSPASSLTITQDSLRLRAAASPSHIHHPANQPQLYHLMQWPTSARPTTAPSESPPPLHHSSQPHRHSPPHSHSQPPPTQQQPIGPYRLSAQPALPTTSHTNHRFHCSECGKSFPSNSALSMHLLVHSGQKPFPCPHCPRRFRQKGHLQSHVRKHTGEKPFVCGMCERGFKDKSGLNTHVKRVHEGGGGGGGGGGGSGGSSGESRSGRGKRGREAGSLGGTGESGEVKFSSTRTSVSSTSSGMSVASGGGMDGMRMAPMLFSLPGYYELNMAALTDQRPTTA